MELQCVPETGITAWLDAAIRDGLVTCFPADAQIFAHTRAWHGSAPSWSIVLLEHEQVIAHVGIVERTITVEQTAIRVAGIQNVFVLPEYRGQGLVDTILTSAMQEALRAEMDSGLLFCLPVLAKVYTRCGWTTINPAEVIRIDEGGQALSALGKNIAMYYPLHRHDFPQGVIYLNGNDW